MFAFIMFLHLGLQQQNSSSAIF